MFGSQFLAEFGAVHHIDAQVSAQDQLVFHCISETGERFDGLFEHDGLLEELLAGQQVNLGMVIAPEQSEDGFVLLLVLIQPIEGVVHQSLGALHELLVDVVFANPVRWVQVETLGLGPLLTYDLIPLLQSVDIGQEALILAPSLDHLDAVLPLSEYFLNQGDNLVLVGTDIQHQCR